jgi:hypothetical protein
LGALKKVKEVKNKGRQVEGQVHQLRGCMSSGGIRGRQARVGLENILNFYFIQYLNME